jgi:hypothetical protein
MYTSYEQRLELLHQFLDGSLRFQRKLTNAKHTRGDGWELYSAGLNFGMFNPVVIETSRKEALEEVFAAIESSGKPSDIRLVGPGMSHTNTLIEKGYRNHGGTPFMMWAADNSVDDFKLRDGLTVRRLVPSDLDVMNVIFADVYEMTPAMIDDMAGMLLASDDDHAYGLFKDGEMVSLVSAMIFNDTIGIWNMGTPTAHQKNGYGLQLLKYVMKTHKEMGSKNFFLFASPVGKILYDKCGWITLDHIPYFSKPSK